VRPTYCFTLIDWDALQLNGLTKNLTMSLVKYVEKSTLHEHVRFYFPHLLSD
jgi:hypothetical protein